MSKTIRFFVALASISAAAGAQTPCRAAARELSAVTAREQLARLTAAPTITADISAAGAECAITGPVHPFSLGGVRLGVESPVVRAEYQGGLPDQRGRGGVPSIRGTTVFARPGVSADFRVMHALLAPEVWHLTNNTFDFVTNTDAARSGFASPAYTGRYSADLPVRFGAGSVSAASLGQSAAWASVGPVDAGVSASAQQWGPGAHGGLLLGADAPGIPRAFLRSSQPLKSPAGAWTFNAFYGTLTESRYFDRDTSNDYRTMRAALVSWSPSDTSTFAVGASHGDMRLGVATGAHHAAQPVRGGSDQINTVFARVRAPGAATRAWVEFARAGALPRFQRFLEVPYQGISYLAGIENAQRFPRGTLLVSAEVANLEQPTDVRGDSTQDFYTSSIIPQGWTQRGQVLGYSAGPGSQSAYVNADWIAPRWSFGVLANRTRWNEDALLRQFLAYPNRHDVSVSIGVHASVRFVGQEATLEASTGKRINYQFQNATYIPGFRTVDVAIPQLRFMLTPALSTSK